MMLTDVWCMLVGSVFKIVRKHHQTINPQAFSTEKAHQKYIKIMQQSI
jgi:hypothetical protein